MLRLSTGRLEPEDFSTTCRGADEIARLSHLSNGDMASCEGVCADSYGYQNLFGW